jgi:hypothetical protein
MCHLVLHQAIYLNERAISLIQNITLKQLAEIKIIKKCYKKIKLQDLPYLIKGFAPCAIHFVGYDFVIDDENNVFNPYDCTLMKSEEFVTSNLDENIPLSVYEDDFNEYNMGCEIKFLVSKDLKGETTSTLID